jgi:uncharacterized protein DUF2188
MPKQGHVHVVYYRDDKAWRVAVVGSERVSGVHARKRPAVEQARGLAEGNKSELVIHNQDGKIGVRERFVPPS